MTEEVELSVGMHCEACAAIVKRAIKKIPGVESFKIDLHEQKVIVTGKVDREDVWQRIHKTGKRATFIPKPAPAKKDKASKKKGEKEKKEEIKEKEKEEKNEEKKEMVKKEGKTQKKKVGNKVADSSKEVKVYGKKEEVVTVLEVVEVEKEKSEESSSDENSDEEESGKKEAEFEPTFVCAPYYTLPTDYLLRY